ncbi:MAG: phosphoribosylanthranilate isomerase [bacterium]|nr:phosphoribosylanthranilate isomerase [bacterium]
MRTRVKICGITNLDDALAAVEAGADALGFIFYRESPRFVSPETVREMIPYLPPMIATVGVFVNEQIERVQELTKYCQISMLQFHGEESPEYCRWHGSRVIKAFRVKDASVLDIIKTYEVSGYLLDAYTEGTYGGTGASFDWSVARQAAISKPIVLAGGLTPDNVGEAIGAVRPYAVDVSSGVEEEPGRKAVERIAAFMEAVKGADAAGRK